MKSWPQPTVDELNQVAVLCARPENRAYFFDRLENPNWLSPLADRGFFDNPPEPVQADEPGYVRFPPWPEGRYLSRMAKLDPELVASILGKINTSENPAVTRLLLETAASLPPRQVRQLSSRIRQWIGGAYLDHFADAAATVITRLFETGNSADALAAMSSVLEVQPDPQHAQKAASNTAPFRATLEPTGRVSEWHYERLIQQILEPALDAAGFETVRLLAVLLEDVLRMSRWNDEAAADDHSYIWRPAIEEHAQNTDRGIRNVLVSAVRDAALRFASRGEDEANLVIHQLETMSIVHRRIALHVLANTSHAGELVSAHIADMTTFDDQRMRHEYVNLLRTRFTDADAQTRDRVLTWIRGGPDVEEYRLRRVRIDGDEPSAEEVQRYIDIWRRDRYSFMAPYLQGRDEERYHELLRSLGEPDHADFVSWSMSWSGPESPLAQEELLQRSPDEVVEYLVHWRPVDDSGWHFGPSIEGLGRVLKDVVAARAQDYAAVAQRFRQVDPTYARALFSGLETALRAGDSFSWSEPLRFGTWVAELPFEPDEEFDDRDRDPGWRWCRREVASLVRSGLTDKASRIPFKYRTTVWQIIRRLTEDPDPTPDHEASYGGDNMDPLTLSINTSRGTAMHAVVEYALWCRRELKAGGTNVTGGFDRMPEVREVLETHLNPNLEPSFAVRAVYGRWLPWLLLLDERWTVEHLDEIFPAGTAAASLAEVAWSTYISTCPPYDSALRALRQQYVDAVRRVPTGKRAGAFEIDKVDAKLGEHLATFYWRNELERPLLEQYFQLATDDLAAHVVEFVGRALQATAREVSTAILERIQVLWEWRFSVCASDPDRHILELRAFGVWFAAEKLDEAWALAALERTIDIAGAPSLGHLVAEHLVEVAGHNPNDAARILAKMLERPSHDWDYIGWQDEAKAIAARAFASGDPDAAGAARRIVDVYVRRGELDFRNLVREQAESG